MCLQVAPLRAAQGLTARPGRPSGWRDYTEDQLKLSLAQAERALGHRRRGWHSETDLATQIGISRQTLRDYRRIYGIPKRRI